MDLNPVELSKQLKKPQGDNALEMGEKLSTSNEILYELAFSVINLNKGDKILEIGFGLGNHFSRYFEMQPELRLTGVDHSSEMCRQAQKNNTGLIEENELELHCVDAASMPVESDSFNYVIALNVIYFWDPPAPYLQEIFRVLKPGGRVLLGYRPRKTVEHLQFTQQNFILYEPRELKALMQENGFVFEYEEQKQYSKKAADGTAVKVVDHCMICKKEA